MIEGLYSSPAVAEGTPALLDLAGISGTSDEKAAWIAEVFEHILETLEPTLILLALTAHHIERTCACGGPAWGAGTSWTRPS